MALDICVRRVYIEHYALTDEEEEQYVRFLARADSEALSEHLAAYTERHDVRLSKPSFPTEDADPGDWELCYLDAVDDSGEQLEIIYEGPLKEKQP